MFETENTMTARDNYYNGDRYANALPYSRDPAMPEIMRKRVADLRPDEMTVLGDVVAAYNTSKAAAKAARDAHDNREREIVATIRLDLETEYGLVGHPKADKLWAMAWDRGHGSGYGEVIAVYEELVELVL